MIISNTSICFNFNVTLTYLRIHVPFKKNKSLAFLLVAGLLCCTEGIAEVKCRQPCLWICTTRSGTVLVVVKAQNSQEPSLAFYTVILLRLFIMCHHFLLNDFQTEHLFPCLTRRLALSSRFHKGAT